MKKQKENNVSSSPNDTYKQFSKISATFLKRLGDMPPGRLMPYLLPHTGKSGGELLNLIRKEKSGLNMVALCFSDFQKI